MASFDFSKLLEPLSAAEPCGPDLDLAGDPDFANTLARVEGVLPASFYTRDNDGNLQPFDRTKIDFPSEFKSLDKLLLDTRDLRVIALYGRLLALNRDLAGFVSCIGSVAALLKERWDEVNPRGDESDFTLRSAVLQAFDEMPTVVLPLQNIPLVESRRSGAISFRSIMVSNDEVQPRADETKVDPGEITRAFEETDLDALKVICDRFRAIRDAADSIVATTTEKAGYDQAPTMERLPPFVARVLGVIEPVLASRDPDAAPASGPASAPGEAGAAPSGAPAAGPAAQASTVPAGRIADMTDAAAALAAVDAYFTRLEPSNPAAILVRHAASLVGRSFMDVMRAIVPGRADEARVLIGPDQIVQLSLPTIAPAAEADEERAVRPVPADADEREPIEAVTRADAVSLLQQIGAFYRRAEPSSPIPLLTERARVLMERDFLALLADLLPAQ